LLKQVDALRTPHPQAEVDFADDRVKRPRLAQASAGFRSMLPKVDIRIDHA
jgi:hypothetical protein